MVDTGGEVTLWRLEWVIGREVDVKEVNTTGVRRFIRSHNSGLPVELILFINRSSRAVGWRILTEVNKFLLNSFKRH